MLTYMYIHIYKAIIQILAFFFFFKEPKFEYVYYLS